MKWNRFTVKTTTEAEDIVICTLAEVGVEGAEIVDKQPLTEEDKEQMFVDIMPETQEDDGVAYLNFYLDEDTDKDEMLKKVREALEELRSFMDIGEGTIEESETEDKDWINNWKEYFHQFYVDDILIVPSWEEELRSFMDIGEGTIEESETEDKDWINNWKEYFHQFYVDDILIVPSWEEVKEEDKNKMILHIDPGTAFGTGMHETTQLVIRQLKKYVTEDTELLDVGTGSGILGIVSLKLGAKHVLGTDLDPCAIPAVAENKEANEIPDEAFDMMIGNIIDDKEVQDKVGYEKYDIVAANILADVLVPLTPVICAIPAVAENKEANEIPDEAFDMMIGNIIDDKEVQDKVGYEKYDIVAANILADVLVPLTPVIVNQMKKGGYYITSGILDVKEDVVVQAVKDAGLKD